MVNSRFSRRKFLSLTGLGVISAMGMSCNRVDNSRLVKKKPNIIVILADDMGYSDIGCYGGEVKTPNLDSLAADGLRFTQFYNSARCCPTRASLLTGLYPHQVGMGAMVCHGDPKKATPGAYQGFLDDKCVTIAQVLKGGGYKTYISGKWHVGEKRPGWPVDRGFDKSFTLISGACNYFDITKAKTKGTKRQMAIDGEEYHPPKDGFYMTDAISDNAINYIKDATTDVDSPFFMYVAYTAPHWPLHAHKKDIEKYRGKYIDGWDELRKTRYKRMIEMGLIDSKWPLSPRDPQVKPWNEIEDKELADLKMAIYAAQIDRMDYGIGRIIKALEKSGQADNTIIMFLSDNGACAETGLLGFDKRKNGLPPGGVDSYMSYGRGWANASNTPYRLYKKKAHEGGIATPLIVKWPDMIKDKGSINHQAGHITDIMATCCDAAGTEYPKTFNDKEIIPLVGKSLKDIFTTGRRKGHEVLYFEHIGNRAIRCGDWKLVSDKRKRWELYNLKTDRTELNDLSGKYPEKVMEMAELYNKWAKNCGVL